MGRFKGCQSIFNHVCRRGRYFFWRAQIVGRYRPFFVWVCVWVYYSWIIIFSCGGVVNSGSDHFEWSSILTFPKRKRLEKGKNGGERISRCRREKKRNFTILWRERKMLKGKFFGQGRNNEFCRKFFGWWRFWWWVGGGGGCDSFQFSWEGFIVVISKPCQLLMALVVIGSYVAWARNFEKFGSEEETISKNWARWSLKTLAKFQNIREKGRKSVFEN